MSECRNVSFKRLFLLAFLITTTVELIAQTIGKPIVGDNPANPFTEICASSSSNSFKVTFNYSSAFDSSNQFIIQLSDADGNFDNAEDPPKEVGRIVNQNNTFGASGNIILPTSTYGKAYRVRIVSTLPAPGIISVEPSDPFEAYYVTSKQLILNEFNQNVAICGNAGATISLNDLGANFSYKWFRNGSIMPGETGSSITVLQEGEYFAAIDYGGCTNTVNSNKVIATIFSPTGVTIEGSNTVELCSNESYNLTASVDEPTYTYKWYKDNVLITGLPDYTPTYSLPTSGQFGVYRLEVGRGECTSSSQDVRVRQKTEANFSVDIEAPSTRLLLPNQTIELKVQDNASSATYQWFKDGVALASLTQDAMNAVSPGVYYVEVTDNSSSCPFTEKSDEYIVLGVKSFTVSIRASLNYEDCVSNETKLSVIGIKAIATDDNEYNLLAEQIALMSYQWYKDDTFISDANTGELTLTSQTDNGEYYANVSAGGSLSSNSDKLSISLVSSEISIQSSSNSNSLCPGTPITLSTSNVSGYTYQWFKGDDLINTANPVSIEINESGIYKLIYEGFGCRKEETIEIVDFDTSVIKISPSSIAALPPGGTILIKASGADFYEWYDERNDLISTNETLEVNRTGTFRVRAGVENCEAEKTIEVVAEDGKVVVPNIVTPFTVDGINDTWSLPNRFAFNPDVQVIVFDIKGNEVFSTVDYQNNWPESSEVRGGMLFYFKIIKNNKTIKAGTISVLE